MSGCLACHKHLARTRGLCPSCYEAVRRRVKKGMTTIEAEVAAGRMLQVSKNYRRQRNLFWEER